MISFLGGSQGKPERGNALVSLDSREAGLSLP